MTNLLRRVVWVVGASILACGGPAEPLSFNITPIRSDLVVGETERIYVQVRDANNKPVTGLAVTYSSTNPAVATVTADGLIEGVRAGTAVIDLHAEGVTGQIPVIVSAISLVIAAPATTVPVGRTLRFTATALNDSGDPVSGPVEWSSAAPDVATVTASGIVTGVSEGQAVIHARAAGMLVDSTVPVTVVAALPFVTGPWSGPVPVTGGFVLLSITLGESNTGVISGSGDFGGLAVTITDGSHDTSGAITFKLNRSGFFPVRFGGRLDPSDNNRMIGVLNESGFNNVGIVLVR